jgi:hypothetical protein
MIQASGGVCLGLMGACYARFFFAFTLFLLCFLDPNLDVSCNNSQVTLSLTSSSPLSKYALEACRVVMVVVVVVVGGSHDNSCLR